MATDVAKSLTLSIQDAPNLKLNLATEKSPRRLRINIQYTLELEKH